jgi:hypothetical protein
MSSAIWGTYVAGLWETELLSELLWKVIYPRSQPKEHRAPSWSWASCDREGTFYYKYPENLLRNAQIKSWDADLVSSKNPFGAVTHAQIELVAVWWAVTLKFDYDRKVYVSGEEHVPGLSTGQTCYMDHLHDVAAFEHDQVKFVEFVKTRCDVQGIIVRPH